MTHLRIKKMLALVIVAALSFGVVGCGGNGANVTAPEVTTEVATTEEMDAESLKLKRQTEEIIEDTNMDYYYATPAGDVMMTGTVGLVKSMEYLRR